jgi:hypothetical protein
MSNQVQGNASPLRYQISQLCQLYFEIPGLSNYLAEISQESTETKDTKEQIKTTSVYIYIYLFLTAIGLTPDGSSTVHIYTQTVHRIQRTEHT